MIEDNKKYIVSALKGEREFFALITKPLGNMYHNLIKGYIKADRGLKEAEVMLNYLFEDNGPFNQLEQITSALEKYIPAMRQESEVIEKIKKDIIHPLINVYKESSERGLFYPEDFAKTSTYLASLRTYIDYRIGINLIRRADLSGRYNEILARYEPYVRAFLIKKGYKNLDFYMGDIDGYGFLVFFVVDSHDNSLLEKRKKMNYEFTLNYCPLIGINNVIFSKIDFAREKFIERLRTRELKKMCLPEFLVTISSIEKIENYYKRIYKNEKKEIVYI